MAADCKQAASGNLTAAPGAAFCPPLGSAPNQFPDQLSLLKRRSARSRAYRPSATP